jgi:hypothetical protein
MSTGPIESGYIYLLADFNLNSKNFINLVHIGHNNRNRRQVERNRNLYGFGSAVEMIDGVEG